MEVQDIMKYFKIIRKWWWVIVLLVGTTVGTMLLIALLTETQYEAKVTLQISAPPPQEDPLYAQFGRQALNEEIERTRSSFSELLTEGDAPYRTLERLPDIPMRGGELRDRIIIDIPLSSQLMRILVRASDPETAALLANTLTEVGLEQYGELLARPTASTRNFIEQELEIVEEELLTAEAELAQFQIANKVGRLDDAMSSQYSLIRSLSTQRDLARVDGDLTEAQTLNEILLEREAELQNLVGLSVDYNRLNNHVQQVRSTHNFLLDRLTEAQIKENQIRLLNSIQIITPAHPPSGPVLAISSKLIALGGVVSLLAGVLLIFLLEYMSLTVAFRRSQSQPKVTDPRRSELVPLSGNRG